jgi:catechol 2,3-dioxygenase-like lactoylglutathione lyase family enzyme
MVKGLGHVGIYVHDLERMVGFYRDVLGMRVTKQNWRAGIVFLSSDPDAADHEIALFRGRPDDVDSRVINQVSLRLETLDDLRAVHKKLIAEGLRARLLLFRSGGKSLRGVLGDRSRLLGADRAPDRHSPSGQPGVS